jgi:hypothetical protein
MQAHYGKAQPQAYREIRQCPQACRRLTTKIINYPNKLLDRQRNKIKSYAKVIFSFTGYPAFLCGCAGAAV